MDRPSHPFRALAAATGLVVLFAATALIFEAYWGVGVFVASVVALFALVEVVGQKINPHVKREGVGEVAGHVETVDEVARFDEDWDRACRMVDRWLTEDHPGDVAIEAEDVVGCMYPMPIEEFGRRYPASEVQRGCPDESCAQAALIQLLVPPYPYAAVCTHGTVWKMDAREHQDTP